MPGAIAEVMTKLVHAKANLTAVDAVTQAPDVSARSGSGRKK